MIFVTSVIVSGCQEPQLYKIVNLNICVLLYLPAIPPPFFLSLGLPHDLRDKNTEIRLLNNPAISSNHSGERNSQWGKLHCFILKKSPQPLQSLATTTLISQKPSTSRANI